MKKAEFLIVGQGVAGSCLALKLMKENKSFLMIDNDTNKASSVAVGIFNPVVLKRFSLIWNADEQLRLMYGYFVQFEKLLGKKFIKKVPTYRIFKNEDEIETWNKKAVQPELRTFMCEKIHTDPVEGINSPFGYAEIRHTGRIDLENCLKSFKEYLTEHEIYRNETFDYSQLEFIDEKIRYKDIIADKIVFCEGYAALKNPFFNHCPIIGVKGEVLKIKVDKDLPEAVWKGYNFLLPTGNKICLTASTYDRDDLTYEPTEKGELEIRKYLEEIYSGSYEVTGHTAGIRPTVLDRRPILGNHHLHKNVYILNGMGTRGTLLAPQMSEFLYNFIESNTVLPREADVRRFDKLLK